MDVHQINEECWYQSSDSGKGWCEEFLDRCTADNDTDACWYYCSIILSACQHQQLYQESGWMLAYQAKTVGRASVSVSTWHIDTVFQVLHGMHALTGCDYTTYLFNKGIVKSGVHGKNYTYIEAMAKLDECPEITQ